MMRICANSALTAQVDHVLMQMLFLDLTLGSLARYSLKLHFPSKFAVSPFARHFVSDS